jgi:hypothetical protein
MNPASVLHPALAIVASLNLVFACAAPSSPPNPAATDASAVDPSPAPPSSGAVKSPIFSTDPCEKDEDCAPVAMCHADKCAARAHAGPTPSDMICTMECRAGTVDCGYNHCGCAPAPSGRKLCALLPGGENR